MRVIFIAAFLVGVSGCSSMKSRFGGTFEMPCKAPEEGKASCHVPNCDGVFQIYTPGVLK